MVRIYTRANFLVVGIMAAGAACGDDMTTSAGSTGDTSTGSSTTNTTNGTMSGTAGTAGTGTETQGGTMSGTDTTATSVTVGTTNSTNSTTAATDSGTTGTTGQTTDSTTGSTTGGVCPDADVCGLDCCDAGEICIDATCVKDCGNGELPCGPDQLCCAGGEICHLSECVTPGPACETQTCATILSDECPDGYVCDIDLGKCLPSAADPNCKYVPDGAFEPTPLFTWGQRKSFNCAQDSDCQTAETCMGGKCTPSWPHVTIAANDMPMHYQSSSNAFVLDLDRDCTPEIIFNSYRNGVFTSDGVLRAIRGDNGAKVWTVTDPAWRTDSTANLAVGDLDGDGNAEIVVQGAGKYLLAFTSEGNPFWKSDTFNMGTGSGSVSIADPPASSPRTPPNTPNGRNPTQRGRSQGRRRGPRSPRHGPPRTIFGNALATRWQREYRALARY